jgi:hypothetical protein
MTAEPPVPTEKQIIDLLGAALTMRIVQISALYLAQEVHPDTIRRCSVIALRTTADVLEKLDFDKTTPEDITTLFNEAMSFHLVDT